MEAYLIEIAATAAALIITALWFADHYQDRRERRQNLKRRLYGEERPTCKS